MRIYYFAEEFCDFSVAVFYKTLSVRQALENAIFKIIYDRTWQTNSKFICGARVLRRLNSLLLKVDDNNYDNL